MCFVDKWDADGVTQVYKRDERRARKRHQCGECSRTIEPGETYVCHHGVCDGSGWSLKSCMRCERVRDALDDEACAADLIVPLGELRCCLRERAQAHGPGGKW